MNQTHCQRTKCEVQTSWKRCGVFYHCSTTIDKQLYAKYGLDETEIAFIEEKVTAME
jgi:hypothetical protein